MTRQPTERLIRSAAAHLIEPSTRGIDTVVDSLSPGAASLAPHVRRHLAEWAPRVVAARLGAVHRFGSGEASIVLHAVDGTVVILSGTSDAEGLTGVGLRALPGDAREWSRKTRFGIVVGWGRGYEGESVARRRWGGTAGADAVSARIGARSEFRVGSIAKVITAAGIVALEKTTSLLEAPVADLLGWWPKPKAADPQVTIRHLVEHRGGLPRDLVADDDLAAAANRAAISEPAYSNVGYAVLGCVIERLTGVAAPDWLTRHILEPLGLSSSGFVATERTVPGYTASCGFVYSAEPVSISETAGGLVMALRDLLTLGRQFALPDAITVGDAPMRLVADRLTEAGVLQSSSAGASSVWAGGTLPGYRTGLVILPGLGAAAAVANSDGWDAVAAAEHEATALVGAS